MRKCEVEGRGPYCREGYIAFFLAKYVCNCSKDAVTRA